MTGEKNTSGRGQRELRVRVKTAKGRKLSSTLWLERQLNDPYVIRAKKEGFRGRAAYKISELDDRYGFLKPGARVVDLGCAPGGWCQIAVERVNALGQNPKKAIGTVLGVDYALTVSCYQADAAGRACGVCDSCRLRRAGFEGAGIADPTRYK